MNKKHILANFEIEQREWLSTAGTREFMWQRKADKIREILGSADIYRLNVSLKGSTLNLTANWSWRSAMIELIDGHHEQAWFNYERAIRFICWEFRLQGEAYLRTKDAEKSASKPRGYWLHPALIGAMAAGDDESTRKLGEFLANHYSTKEFADDAFGEGWPELTGFALYLYLQWRGTIEGLDYPEAINLGIYRKLFDHWHDEDLHDFSEALYAILDRHIDGMWDKKPYSFRFELCPYGFFPTEYYAIQKIREKQGLAMPSLDDPKFAVGKHPLLAGPFGTPPDPMPRAEDTIFDQAMERVREAYPDV